MENQQPIACWKTCGRHGGVHDAAVGVLSHHSYCNPNPNPNPNPNDGSSSSSSSNGGDADPQRVPDPTAPWMMMPPIPSSAIASSIASSSTSDLSQQTPDDDGAEPSPHRHNPNATKLQRIDSKRHLLQGRRKQQKQAGDGGIAGKKKKKKKRKLSAEQWRGLERSFEERRALDSRRKARLARDLGLQEQQIATWYQNRRARSKAMELETAFSALQASYDALQTQRSHLLSQIANLSMQLKENHDNNFNHQDSFLEIFDGKGT